MSTEPDAGRHRGLARPVRFFLDNPVLAAVLAVAVILGGLLVSPFGDEIAGLPTRPVPVDAIPDIGENQQIVFTEWPGRSPQDVEDQVTYPLTVALLGVPSVKTVRSYSYFGYSSIFVVFEEDAEFYWTRARLSEKLGSLPPGTLPEGVRPALGPDATALGQVFWYTVEGEGFDLHELRSIQDYTVRYALLAADGVAEVASVGGFVREYQVDVDPDAMRAYGVRLQQVFDAVRRSNVDVGARTIEVNRAEYVVRGIGFLKRPEDLERTVITSRDHVPIYVGNVARVTLGPALRRGALDKEGAEVVGGVVVVRHGANPLQVIENVRRKIAELEPGLPQRVLPDGRRSQVRIVPFYDRTELIHETLGTLSEALTHEMMLTVVVVIVLVFRLRGSLLIASLLPMAVLGAFIGMKLFSVDSNVMSLAGIAIAVGTMVDMGVIVCESILRRLDDPDGEGGVKERVARGATEVAGAMVTAIATTIVSFLPVFVLDGPEGKLFRPLAFTKTFALAASVVLALALLPAAAHLFLPDRRRPGWLRAVGLVAAIALGVVVGGRLGGELGVAVALLGGGWAALGGLPERVRSRVTRIGRWVVAASVVLALSQHWRPLGPETSGLANALWVGTVVGGALFGLWLFARSFETVLRWLLQHKLAFAVAPLLLVTSGACAWLGFDRVFQPVAQTASLVGISPDAVRSGRLWRALATRFPGLGEEFMPRLDEGAFLYMPTTMPHASIGEALDQLQKIDRAIRALPEVDSVVGKLGRADTPLDPAPISMFEVVVDYKSEYRRDPQTGRRVQDDDGRPIRQWRDHIHSPDDIWREIVAAARLPGVTSAPYLQPIAARTVMLQSGMRAPMGVKVQGQTLEQIEQVGLEIERWLKSAPGVDPGSVIADRTVGKPYLEIEIDRELIARHDIDVRDVQDVIEIAIGGRTITQTVEGRERYPVRVRYLRELRDSPESIGRILVPTPDGHQIPLVQLAELRYVRGPQVIKSEDTFLVGYVIFDKSPGWAEVDAVDSAAAHLRAALERGDWSLPAGARYSFVGSYENQLRTQRTLALVVPSVLVVIFVILYLQFRSVPTTLLVFSGVAVAAAGGFLLLWLYGTDGFLDLTVLGVDMRELFRIRPIHLSVAVWVGFIGLFGIATDDGVVMATYLDQAFRERRPGTVAEVRAATLHAARRRLRPCLMTAATTALALLPVLMSTGRGSEVMIPMAIPAFGGMCVVLLTLFVVPVGYCALAELRLRRAGRPAAD